MRAWITGHGRQRTRGEVQPLEIIQVLKVLCALLPCVCNVIAFPISQTVNRRILEGITLIKQGQAAADPLKP